MYLGIFNIYDTEHL